MYFRKPGFVAVPLPDLEPDDPAFAEAYALAVKGITDFPKPTNISVARMCLYAVRRARNRAKERGLPFALTAEMCLQMIQDQKYRCAMTNIKFSGMTPEGSRRRPFAPSIDQIIAGKGYTVENSRIVCVIVNTSLSDFGDFAFYQMCRAVVTNRERIFPTLDESSNSA